MTEQLFRILVVRDYPFGEDNEIEFISLCLDQESIPHTIIADERDPGAVDRHRADIVVLDYGGMSSMGAYESAAFNIRYVANWAEEHPSVALLVWSHMTADILASEMYRKEIGEAFSGAPANVFNIGGSRAAEEDKIWRLVRAMIGAAQPDEEKTP